MAKITNYKYARKLYFIYAGTSILFMLIAQSLTSTTIIWILMVLGGLLVLGAFVWVIVSCQSLLPLSYGFLNYCPYCSKELE